ncbi:Uncharacterised protein [Mycobacterium tuberculosis]|nr:Uncharacterised protein [Mycobacterium tuberculosis]CKR77133.1 Uncharacterised protein [Mycobacterium tuberculosis]CKS28984.1 Uncharacterised protein [Mycobacterium tuberculosis]CKS88628.1 Uncharacterised protein [Mycobacterium tuberculosis]CKT19600.1 Uncharacterised protein [Mycobacterium tuberculosis]
MFSGFRCRSSAIAASMMLGCPEPPDPPLVSIASRPSMDTPDTWLPRLPKPEITAGAEPSVLTLNMPEMSTPEFSTPDARLPALPRPESVPTIGLEAWFSKPDTPAPKLAMPEPPPPPVLKKPDDGSSVELPKPGSAGMSMIEMLMGPALLRTSKFSGIGSILVPVMVTAGMSTDTSIGTTSDIEIPLIVEAGMSIGGMSMGMDWLNEIAGNSMASMVCCSGRGNPPSVAEVRGMATCI